MGFNGFDTQTEAISDILNGVESRVTEEQLGAAFEELGAKMEAKQAAAEAEEAAKAAEEAPAEEAAAGSADGLSVPVPGSGQRLLRAVLGRVQHGEAGELQLEQG